MTRYIDADLLLQRLTGINSAVEQGIKYYNAVYNLIKEQPTSDVVEVKHGYWVEDIKEITPFNGIVPIKALVGYRCSVCNRPEFRKEPYCNCGAKMDGGS